MILSTFLAFFLSPFTMSEGLEARCVFPGTHPEMAPVMVSVEAPTDRWSQSLTPTLHIALPDGTRVRGRAQQLAATKTPDMVIRAKGPREMRLTMSLSASGRALLLRRWGDEAAEETLIVDNRPGRCTGHAQLLAEILRG
ncbi:hypothetical protein RM543_14630 [Roseicyclus sp. F158]|uniref:Uncharacterized protein n=1 Tax=Tropicimonas omnivorans TaxID=3075590 RepID=A0ABU3DK13_9RHOB|nr:hypothetical protein [Roseicyclus sp. F158]MDT0683923.1 hypothetical protein [Roseicyclus sp. F158]